MGNPTKYIPARSSWSTSHPRRSLPNPVSYLKGNTFMRQECRVRQPKCHPRISCKFTSGCLSHVPRSRVPCAVLHLLSKPKSVDDLLIVPCTTISASFDCYLMNHLPTPASKLMSPNARTALASKRIYRARSWIRRVYAPKLEGSVVKAR